VRVKTSLVVPVHNAEKSLGDLLTSLIGQEEMDRWEVVIVDNNSTDGSMVVAQTFRDRLPLRFVSARERANPSYARNAGAASSSADNLLFVDADDAVGPGYVKAMDGALSEHPLVTSSVDSGSLNPAWVRGAHGPPWQTEGVAAFFGFLPAAGVNIGIKRTLFESLGGFPEAFSGSEDMAFSWNAQLVAGVAPYFVREAVYRYRYRTTIRELFLQGAHWGRDSVLLYRTFRTKGMPGRPISAVTGDWGSAIAGFVSADDQSARAPFAVRLGLCAGRLRGSLQYRTFYL